jgi:SAM-dependent methyltransferase
MHPNSWLVFDEHVASAIRDGDRVLEVGPDAHPSTYCRRTPVSVTSWDTVDLYESGELTFQAADPYTFPIDSGFYDVVISGNVIEHVRKPWRWVPELARVARPGGLVVTITPVSWPYHEAPLDCWRMYPEGLTALYEDAGLAVEFSWWGSLESSAKRVVPGRSEVDLPGRWRWYSRVASRTRFPVERAFDTVVLGRKPRG